MYYTYFSLFLLTIKQPCQVEERPQQFKHHKILLYKVGNHFVGTNFLANVRLLGGGESNELAIKRERTGIVWELTTRFSAIPV